MSLSKIIRSSIKVFAGMLLVMGSVPTLAADVNIVGPPGSVRFGRSVTVLPNGNIVVVDSEGPGPNIGSVHLYSRNGILISTLTGGSSGDFVGSSGITVLPNGNFLVRSGSWRNPATSAAGAGAITWVNGTSGLSGVVSESNSLVGTSAEDNVGRLDVLVLATGNYVVQVTSWDNGSVEDAGAVIWVDGNVGISGQVTTSNALYGTQPYDKVGRNVFALSNGNYVVGSFLWDNGTIPDAGAATWGNGNSGVIGAVSSANSLVGTSAGDQISMGGITTLGNGNYVVPGKYWNYGIITDAGAATWVNGNTGRVGVVSSANSLVGQSVGDQIGSGGIIALANGNYVVSSPKWTDGAHPKMGAATWGNGSSGLIGTISIGNSLVGASADDGSAPANEQYEPLVALANGNYVVVNPGWDNGAVADVGAVTWADGTSGGSGVISAGNSLIGSTAGDAIGAGKTIALTNGNYVVASDLWHRGATPRVGAVTWANGTSGLVGVVSTSNSLVGSTLNDSVGSNVYALDNGNYVVASTLWNNGAMADVGAVTRCNGNNGRVGVVSPANSLIGSSTGDLYGKVVFALANGDYIAASSSWDSGGVADLGAFTRVDGTIGLSGVPSAANSIVGSIAGDFVSAGTPAKLGANHYAVPSLFWNNGGIVNAGAVTILQNAARTRGLISTANSILGTATFSSFNVAYDPVLDRALVGRPQDNVVTIRALSLFADGFE